MKKFIKRYGYNKKLWFKLNSGFQVSASKYRYLRRKIPIIDIEKYIIYKKAKKLLCL